MSTQNSTLSAARSSAPLATLWGLVAFHILVIAASNYLVQLPVEIFGFYTTWGAFSFPLVYVATDLTVRIYGPCLARKIIARVMLPALLISYVMSVIFYEGAFQGFEALAEFNTFVARIAFASFAAYLIGQLMDIRIFAALRALPQWWAAPLASSVLGNAFDSIVFFSVAFYKSSDAFMADNWIEIGLVDYVFKFLICALFMLPLYGMLLNYLKQRLSFDSERAPAV